MLSQAAAEQREKTQRGYLTIISWHTQGEAGLLLGGHDKWQTTDGEGVWERELYTAMQSICQTNSTQH